MANFRALSDTAVCQGRDMAQFTPDGVPTIDGCRPAVLRVMADGQERPLRGIIEAVAEYMELPDDVVAQKVPSGQGRLENRVGWATSSFFRAGLLDRPKRGWYQITHDGRVVDQRSLLEYSEDDLKEWATWRSYLDELQERKDRSQSEEDKSKAAVEPAIENNADPMSLIAEQVQSLNNAVETELRSALQRASPEFFERAVLEVLWAMGYGGGQGEKQHLGKSHDGGIDGLIRQDPLGLQNVYVQAKRYADSNNVGSPDINSFYGALARRGADRGVFITTSSFSPAAREASKQFGGKIVLIDGIQLTSLMLRYGVGVEPREQFTIFEVNQDFFDD